LVRVGGIAPIGLLGVRELAFVGSQQRPPFSDWSGGPRTDREVVSRGDPRTDREVVSRRRVIRPTGRDVCFVVSGVQC
jgi:hypothetical protein